MNFYKRNYISVRKKSIFSKGKEPKYTLERPGRSHFIQNTLWKALPTKQKYAHFTYQKPGKNFESATNPGHRLPLPLSHPPPKIGKKVTQINYIKESSIYSSFNIIFASDTAYIRTLKYASIDHICSHSDMD